MSGILWMNVPLMVLFLGLMTGIPLWMVLRRQDWRDKPESRTIPAYLAARRTARIHSGLIRVPVRATHYDSRLSMRPLSGGAKG